MKLRLHPKESTSCSAREERLTRSRRIGHFMEWTSRQPRMPLTPGPDSWRLRLDPEPGSQQHSIMRWLGLGLLALAAVSCGSDSFNPGEINLAGTWVFSATIQETSQNCNVSEAPITFSAVSPDSLVGQGGVGGTIAAATASASLRWTPTSSTPRFSDPQRQHRSDRAPRVPPLCREIRSENRMSGTTTIDSLPGSWVAERQ